MRVVLTRLLTTAANNELTSAITRQALLRSGAFAVVTAEEDRALARAGVRSCAPDTGDVWSRYRVAGVDVGDLAPLTLNLL